MKKILLVVLTCFCASVYATETKKVCHDKTVNGKTVPVCKMVKIHKKVDGTPVPEKKNK
jgi:hypothetical protein